MLRRMLAAAAVPVALILNELLCNALKHAFPDGRSGSIRLQGYVRGDDVILSVVRGDTTVARATITIERMKDGEEGMSWTIEVRSMEVGRDRNKNPKFGGYVVLVDERLRPLEALYGFDNVLNRNESHITLPMSMHNSRTSPSSSTYTLSRLAGCR